MQEKIVVVGINGPSINKDFDEKKLPKFQNSHVKNGSSVKSKKNSNIICTQFLEKKNWTILKFVAIFFDMGQQLPRQILTKFKKIQNSKIFFLKFLI